MNKPIIYFSHGKESGPWGTKISYLLKIARDLGCETNNIDYSETKHPEKRVKILLNEYDSKNKNVILYGSSMGGYVSMLASQIIKPKGIFLTAPAFYLPNYKYQEFQTPKCEVNIIHGWQDEVVPAENSIKFALKHKSELHIIKGDHSLNDQLSIIGVVFKNFLLKTIKLQTA